MEPIEQWGRLHACWVNVNGERVGWISKHHDHFNIYNLENLFVGRFPDLGAAIAALSDPRAQDWKALVELGGFPKTRKDPPEGGPFAA